MLTLAKESNVARPQSTPPARRQQSRGGQRKSAHPTPDYAAGRSKPAPAVRRAQSADSAARPVRAIESDEGNDLLTIAQVLTLLDVPQSTFYRWRQLGRGPRCIKLPNGAVRVRRSEYDRWLGELEESA